MRHVLLDVSANLLPALVLDGAQIFWDKDSHSESNLQP